MKTSSAKAKGRNLQKHVCQSILRLFNTLEPDDCQSRSMGAGGEDIMLSPAARKLLPVSIECKSHARFAIYGDYEQAKSNAGKFEPIVIIKQNNSKPLVIMDLDYWLKLRKEVYEKTKETNKEA